MKFSEALDLIDETRKPKWVIRKGKKVKKFVTDNPNKKIDRVSGKEVAKSASDKLTLKKAAKKRKMTMRGKSKTQSKLSRKLSLKKRKSSGLK